MTRHTPARPFEDLDPSLLSRRPSVLFGLVLVGLLLPAAFALPLAGCGDAVPSGGDGADAGLDDDAGGGAPSCIPGQTDFCACAVGQGVRECDRQGFWGACDCAPIPDADGDADAAGSDVDAGGSDDATDTGDDAVADAEPDLPPDPVCGASGAIYGRERLDEDMYPGRACIACHTREGEGPRLGAAGTVFPFLGYRNDCGGVSGVTVEIVDANGVTRRMRTGATGNFLTESTIATPYTASVISSAGTRRMVTPQTDTDCNTCHTAEGAEGAPGRIVP